MVEGSKRLAILCGPMMGGALPVRWIGRQTVAGRFTDERRLPIRIREGALGPNVPCRDLLVSSDHALLVDDVLINAGALINGTSIVRERTSSRDFHLLPRRIRRSLVGHGGEHSRRDICRQCRSCELRQLARI